ADSDHGLDLGEDLVGRVVGLELAPACPLPRPVSLLRRVLHAALLGGARPSARQPLGRLRALRGRTHPRLVPRHPPGGRLHSPDSVHGTRPAEGRLDVRDVLRLVGGDAGARRLPVPARAGRKAPRRAAPRAQGAARRMTTSEKYVAAAYLVVFVVVLVYVLI